MVFARNCCVARMLPREVELVPERTGMVCQGLLLLSFAFTISKFASAASRRPHHVLGVILICRRRSKSPGTRSQYASLFGVHRSRRVARRCNHTHACCCGMVHGPASDRNRFSRHHWPRGRSIPGSWMVGSLINDLFWTSTICHRVRQRCWMGSEV